MKRLDVDVRLNLRATEATVLALEPDVVVVATGSKPARSGASAWRPAISGIPGAELDHVVTSWEVLDGSVETGASVLIIDEDPHLQACALAEHLASHGKQVHLLTASLYIGQNMPPGSLGPAYGRLLGLGVRLSTHTLVDKIEVERVHASDLFTGTTFVLEGVDTVVLAMGQTAQDTLVATLSGRVPELHAVGDCVAPRLLGDAIFEGHRTARLI